MPDNRVFALLLLTVFLQGCKEPVHEKEIVTSGAETQSQKMEDGFLLTKEEARMALIKMIDEAVEERQAFSKREEKIRKDNNEAYDKLKGVKEVEAVKKLHEMFEDKSERELALLLLEEETEKQIRYIHGYYNTLTHGLGLSKDWDKDYSARSEEDNAKREMIYQNENFAKLFQKYQVIELPYSGDYEIEGYDFSTAYSRNADFRREKEVYWNENRDKIFQDNEVIEISSENMKFYGNDGNWHCNLKEGWFRNYSYGHLYYGCFIKDEKGEWCAKGVGGEGGNRLP